ncbi:FecCD family ABC transporter permease [Natronospora cellulosivora (SeqCode)]
MKNNINEIKKLNKEFNKVVNENRKQRSHISENNILKDYQNNTKKKIIRIITLIVFLFFFLLLSLSLGSSSFGAKESLQSLFFFFFPEISGTIAYNIIWSLRLPRVLMAIVAGIGLAASGLIMQSILHNPLASPYTLGISSAASFGAALSIILRSSFMGLLGNSLGYELPTIITSFFFAVLCILLIYYLSKRQKSSSETIILLGIAMMYLFSAGLSLLQYIGDPDELAELVYWMFGSLSRSNWSRLGITSLIIVIIIPVLYKYSWDFNALAANDETAQSLGINVEKLRLKGLILASLMTAIITSFLGPIAFIGLVAPHIGRMLIGGDHRFLLPISSLIGAILLLLSDTVARTILSPIIIPVGIITSFIGVPLFIHLMLKRRREFW